jgi:hypothetical protein
VGSGKAEVGVPTVKEVEARRTTQGNRGSGSPDAVRARGQLGAGGVEDEGGSDEPGDCDSVEAGDRVARGGTVAHQRWAL